MLPVIVLLVCFVLCPLSIVRAQTFDILDQDHNGVLTYSEFRSLANDNDRMEQAFNRMDQDGDGLLSRHELGLDGRRLLRRADADDDGQLSREELKAFFSQDDPDPAFIRMDENGDGQLEKHEYFLQKEETKAGFWVPLVKF